jgi:hypothetical protein
VGAPPWGAGPTGAQPWGATPWGATPWGATPWGTPPAPDPRERRRRRRRAALALGSVVVLLIALLGLSQLVEQRRSERVREQITAALPELQAFVEQERGLPFLEEVDVEVLDDDAFLEALYAPSPGEPEPREDRDAERTLVALGLLDEQVDLDEAVTDSLDEGVVGFYDPVDGRLAVRGREVDAFVELVLVHELTHALQDQHFDTARPELDEADDERGLAFRSLVEGDAVRVENAWIEAQPRAVQQELLDLFSGGAPSDGEPVVEALLGFPYEAGPGLVEALLARGGQEALDAAFREPPTTGEQVLDPAPVPPPTSPARTSRARSSTRVSSASSAWPCCSAATRSRPARSAGGTATATSRSSARAHLHRRPPAVDDPRSGAELEQALREQDDVDVTAEPGGTLLLQSCVG